MLYAHIIECIRSEYLGMPGLRLTVSQAERLCGVEPTLCKAVLDALVDAKFLALTRTGLYVRATDGAPTAKGGYSSVDTRAVGAY